MLRRTPLKRGNKGLKKTPLKKSYPKKEKDQSMELFFLECWDRRMSEVGEIRCYETGKIISDRLRMNSRIYHHILQKGEGAYPEYEFEYWNICFLLPEVHDQVHADIDKTPKVRELTKKLKELYG